MMNNIGLYIHVPFCVAKCPYCDFYSVGFDSKLAKEYTEAVIRNINHYGRRYDTVYFGGGTPILMADGIAKILRNADIAEGAEITVEANPCVTDEKALTTLLESGVNRISFGVQSLNEDELFFLGRRHTPEEAVNAINLSQKAGFTNISADIMLGLMGQRKENIKHTVDGLSSLPLNHISAYLLKIEPNTPFAMRRMMLPDDELMAELYLYTSELLEENGFFRYEISNFSKSGYECKHNLKYWRCEEYLGIGAAAHSYLNGVRFCTDRDIEKFISSDVQETVVTDEKCGDFEELAMLKLRLAEGLSFEEASCFGTMKNELLKRIKLIPEEYLDISETGIALTAKGALVSNTIIAKIIGL